MIYTLLREKGTLFLIEQKSNNNNNNNNFTKIMMKLYIIIKQRGAVFNACVQK